MADETRDTERQNRTDNGTEVADKARVPTNSYKAHADDPDDIDRLEDGVCETCGAGPEEPHLTLYHALRGTEW